MKKIKLLTIIGWIYTVVGAIGVLTGALAFFILMNPNAVAVIQQYHNDIDDSVDKLRWMFFVQCLPSFILGVLLLRRKETGRMFAIIYNAFNFGWCGLLLGMLLTEYFSKGALNLFINIKDYPQKGAQVIGWLIISGLLLIYFTRPKVKEQFRQ